MFADVKLTHISTACAILTIDGVTFITDPVFCPAHTQFDMGIAILEPAIDPALSLAQLPHLDCVLLSHEDHPDNLDPEGRKLLDGRLVLTTPDGAKKLAPRPHVKALKEWETLELEIGGKQWKITGIPCVHLPGGEVVGFVLERAEWGVDERGRPNAIWISGDTVWHEGLTPIGEKYNIQLATLNVGHAQVPALPNKQMLVVTMDGHQAAHAIRTLHLGKVVPMHFEGWGHFFEGGDALKKVLADEGIKEDQVCWLEPGVEKKIVL